MADFGRVFIIFEEFINFEPEYESEWEGQGWVAGGFSWRKEAEGHAGMTGFREL